MNYRLQGQAGHAAGFVSAKVVAKKVSALLFDINLTGADVSGTATINASLVHQNGSEQIIDSWTLDEVANWVNGFGGNVETDVTSKTLMRIGLLMGEEGNCIQVDEGEELLVSVTWATTSLTAGTVMIGSLSRDSDNENYVPKFQKASVTLASGSFDTVYVGTENCQKIGVYSADITDIDNITVQDEDDGSTFPVELAMCATTSFYKIEATSEPTFVVLTDHSNPISSIKANPSIQITGSDTGACTVLSQGQVIEQRRATRKASLHNHAVANRVNRIAKKYPERYEAMKAMGTFPDVEELNRALR